MSAWIQRHNNIIIVNFTATECILYIGQQKLMLKTMKQLLSLCCNLMPDTLQSTLPAQSNALQYPLCAEESQ